MASRVDDFKIKSLFSHHYKGGQSYSFDQKKVTELSYVVATSKKGRYDFKILV